VATKLNDDWTLQAQEALPRAGQLVLVLCCQDHYIGYRDDQGRWRHAVLHKELMGVVGWCALSAKGW
jgi:hypothetical protein